MAYTGPFPHKNTGTTAAITVSHTSFTGSVNNTGNIAPGGLAVVSGVINAKTAGSTTAILDSGYIAGGISVDASSFLFASKYGIEVTGKTFAGGINNAGTINTTSTGILVTTPSTAFTGGILNTGSITSKSGDAIYVDAGGLSTWTGSVINSGKISAQKGEGIYVYEAGYSGNFNGAVVNSGGITAKATGLTLRMPATRGTSLAACSIPAILLRPVIPEFTSIRTRQALPMARSVAALRTTPRSSQLRPAFTLRITATAATLTAV